MDSPTPSRSRWLVPLRGVFRNSGMKTSWKRVERKPALLAKIWPYRAFEQRMIKTPD
jgi:hypothetical protein